jgi:mannose-1-phosphate guanylyltransferase
MTNIILCGGSGTRLWPVSQPEFPKQFCRFFGEFTLFQSTVLRNSRLAAETLIVTNTKQAGVAAAQYKELALPGKPRFVLEPMGRNTAPALALACLEMEPTEVVMVTPSDHVIRDEVAYESAVRLAIEAATAGKLVTFGLKPEYPETGYGYIEAAKAVDGLPGLPVASFREKPDRKTAEGYCADPRFHWNSGMFCFQAGTFLDELGEHAPDILAAARLAHRQASRGMLGASDGDYVAPSPEDMEAIRPDSIDYAVMEKSGKVRVIPCSIGWSDLGSFDALYDGAEKDEAGNSTQGECLLMDSRRNLVMGGERPVVLIGLEDCIIVDRPEALVVMARGRSQEVKKAAELRQAKGNTAL